MIKLIQKTKIKIQKDKIDYDVLDVIKENGRTKTETLTTRTYSYNDGHDSVVCLVVDEVPSLAYSPVSISSST